MPTVRSLPFALLLPCLAVWVGCGPHDEITQIVLPKHRAGLPLTTSPNMAKPADSTSGPRRMVVAMTERPEASWFFKIDGPLEAVTLTQPVWTEFLTRIRFSSNGQPEWTLPANWEALPPQPARFATLAIPAGDRNIELVVSSLPAGQSILDNVNRWLGQLGLPATTADQLSQRLGALEFENGSFIVFDEQVGGGDVVSSNAVAESSASPSPDYTVPDGWRFHQASQFVAATYLREFEAGTAQIAVSRMPATVVSWETVVAMWIDQVEWSGQRTEDVLATSQDVEIGGRRGQQIVLVPADGATQNALIGVRVEVGTDAWYFKLSGNRRAVEQARGDFEALLRSVTFNNK